MQPTCLACGSPWFEVNDQGLIECCDCDTLLFPPGGDG